MSKIVKRNGFIAVATAVIVLMAVMNLHTAALAQETDSNKLISAEDAKNIVLEKIPGARIHDFELDKERGRDIYEGEAILDGYEYEFEIDAVSGEILQWEKELAIYDDDGGSGCNAGFGGTLRLLFTLPFRSKKKG